MVSFDHTKAPTSEVLKEAFPIPKSTFIQKPKEAIQDSKPKMEVKKDGIQSQSLNAATTDVVTSENCYTTIQKLLWG